MPRDTKPTPTMPPEELRKFTGNFGAVPTDPKDQTSPGMLFGGDEAGTAEAALPELDDDVWYDDTPDSTDTAGVESVSSKHTAVKEMRRTKSKIPKAEEAKRQRIELKARKRREEQEKQGRKSTPKRDSDNAPSTPRSPDIQPIPTNPSLERTDSSGDSPVPRETETDPQTPKAIPAFPTPRGADTEARRAVERLQRDFWAEQNAPETSTPSPTPPETRRLSLDIGDVVASPTEISPSGEIPPDYTIELSMAGLCDISGTTSQGGPKSKLTHNEDALAVLVAPDGSVLAAVIDGSGGSGSAGSTLHPGHEAMKVAIDTFKHLGPSSTRLDGLTNQISTAVTEHGPWKGKTDANERGYACGAFVRLHKDGRVEMTGAGDTRAFLFSRDGHKKKATMMQNMAAIRADGDAEKALFEPHLSVITHGLGISTTSDRIDIAYRTTSYIDTSYAPGDFLVLCSDGVGDVVTETEISKIISENPNDATKIKDRIMTLAFQRNNRDKGQIDDVLLADGTTRTMTSKGRGDNITVQVIRISESNLVTESDLDEDEDTAPITAAGTQLLSPQTHVTNKPTAPSPIPTESRPPQNRTTTQEQTPPPTKTRKTTLFRWGSAVLALGAAALTAFGLRLSTDRGANQSTDTEPEVTEPVLGTASTPDTSSRYFAADVGIPAGSTVSTSEGSSETVDTTAATDVARKVLDEAIDNELAVERVEEKLYENLIASLGRDRAESVVHQAHDVIARLVQSTRNGNWGAVVDATQIITQRVRNAVPSTSTPNRRLPTGSTASTHPRLEQNPLSALDAWSTQTHPTAATSRRIDLPVLPSTAQDDDRAYDYTVARDAEQAEVAAVRARIAATNADIRARQAADQQSNTADTAGSQPRPTTARTDRAFIPVDPNLHTYTGGRYSEPSGRVGSPMPDVAGPSATTPSQTPETSVSNTTEAQRLGAKINYLNTRTGVTIERIMRQYPNGIADLTPSQIRDLRQGLRANTLSLVDYIKAIRAFEQLLEKDNQK